MKLTYKCMHNPTHSFKGENRNMDGVSCPICGGPVLHGPYDEGKDSNLPNYRDLKKQLPKPKSAITIDLNFDDKSKLKLRAIAKHAGALADELDRIDNAWQCECGSTEYVTTFGDGFLADNQCIGCGKHFRLPNEDELEGSE